MRIKEMKGKMKKRELGKEEVGERNNKTFSVRQWEQKNKFNI